MLLAQVSAAPAGCQVWSHNVLAAHGRRFAYIGTLSIYVYAADADGSYGLEKVLNGPDEVMGGVSWSPLDASRLVVTVADHLVVWDVDMGVEAQRIRVDGVYSDDPERNPHAVLYRELTYSTVLEQNLRVMDHTAITHCMEHAMPLLVFNFKKAGNIVKAVQGEPVGTYITSK